MSGLVNTVATTSNPVTRAEALQYLKQNAGTSDDALVDDLILMATEQVEIITEHQLNDATYIQYFDGWPKYSMGGSLTDRLICLDKPPLQSVTSVKYRDSDGNAQTITSTNYIVDNVSQAKSQIVFNTGYSLPTVDNDNAVNSVYVEFVAGYETWQSGVPGVPPSLKTAILVFINEIYEHRLYELEGSITGSLMGNKKAMQCLGSYRVNTPTAIGLGGSIPINVR